MFRVRVALVIIALAAALAAGLLAGIFLTRGFSIGVSKTPVTTPAVVREIQTLSQLATVKYVIEKVVVEEDVKWFGENRVFLVAHGVVKAGVDFEKLKPEDVEASGTHVRIHLPPPQYLDAYLDESKTQIIERTTGLLRVFDKDLETVARQHAVMDIRRAAIEQGILEDAKERAHVQIEALLHRMGFEEVEIITP